MLYPIFLKLSNKPVLVVGGGSIAEQKIQGLLEAGARVTVLAPEISQSIRALALQNKLTLIQRRYIEGDVAGFVMVFGATDDPIVQESIYRDAASRNIPVNIVDVPERCSFYLGSVFQRGDLKIAISTNGKSPTLGKIIRDKIRGQFSEGYPELLDKLGEMRSTVFAKFPEYEQRKEIFAQLVTEEVKRIEQGSLCRRSSSSSFPNALVGNLYSVHERFPARPNDVGAPSYAVRTGRSGRLPKTCGNDKESIVEIALKGLAGKVYLVGAGPGDPDLITVKALRILQSADVVVYDALIGKGLLNSAKDTAELIFAGKRSNHHSMKQDEINSLLIAKAKSGKSVVRLKGGDPFVFGRGGEELEALRDAGVEVEVIPGITAGVGILTAAGIPLTHRQISSSAAFVTGHECGTRKNPVDWEALAAVDTLVIYMGVRNIESIAQRLLDAGRSRETPVAVIFSGTLPDEVIIEGTLETIAEKVSAHPTDAPGLIVVGEVVQFLEKQNAPFLSDQSDKSDNHVLYKKEKQESLSFAQ